MTTNLRVIFRWVQTRPSDKGRACVCVLVVLLLLMSVNAVVSMDVDVVSRLVEVGDVGGR